MQVATLGPIPLRDLDLCHSIRIRDELDGSDRPPIADPDRPIPQPLRSAILEETFRRLILRHLAHQRGLVVSDLDLQRTIDEARARAQSTDAGPRLREPDPELLRIATTERILQQRLGDALADTLTDDDLRQAWRRANETAVLEVVLVPNLPDPADITRTIAERSDEIDTWYRDHRNHFRLPRRLRVRELRIDLPPGAPEHAIADVERRLSELRDRARAGEDFAELARVHSTAPSAERGGDAGWVVPKQRPSLFRLAPGDVSDIVADPVSRSIYRIEEEAPPGIQPLDDTLRRQIASTILRREAPAPRALDAARRILDSWQRDGTPDPDLLRASHTRVETTPPFPPGVPERVPIVGYSEEIAGLVGTALTEPGTFHPTPIHTERNLVLLRLVRHTPADPATFEAQAPALRAQLRDEVRDTGPADEISRWRLAHPTEVDEPAVDAAIRACLRTLR